MRCKVTARILIRQTFFQIVFKKSSFFLKTLCLLDFYYSFGGGSIENGRTVARSHGRIFLLHMRELYIWNGRIVLYLLYIIFIYYISIYIIINRTRTPERWCDRATVRPCDRLFPVQKSPSPTEKSPSYAYVGPNFCQTAAATSTPKNGRITSFFGLRRRQKGRLFTPQKTKLTVRTPPSRRILGPL